MTCRRARLLAGFAGVVVLSGCIAGEPPPGGVAPELGAVPPRPVDLYTAAEKRAVFETLVADQAEAGRDRAVVEHRMGMREAPPEAPPPQAWPTAGPPVTPQPAPLPLPPVDPPGLAGLIVAGAGGLVVLADLASFDRQGLLLRTAPLATDRPAMIPDGPQSVTAVVFGPGSAVLTPLERSRLELALDLAGQDGGWVIDAMGPTAAIREQRQITLLAALADFGIDPATVTLRPSGRDVDLAEVLVQR
ncbi:MAG: hypothetical protein AAFX81_17340 [Pseudomonadota bacterium]